MGNRIRAFFTIDEEYSKEVQEFSRRDAVYALLIYTLILISYYFMGVLHAMKNIYLGNAVNLSLAFLVIGLTLIRKQPLKSIGISGRNLGKSIVLGLVPSILLLAAILVIGFAGGSKLAGISSIFGNFMYFLFIISFVEELLFRGYIQTRLYGLLHKPIPAIIITGILFMLMHIPYRMGVAQMGVLEYITNNYITLLITFLWHVIFRFLYSKYNSILAPTIFHAFVNWTGYLFVQ
ncbi:MAG: hypothetical protein K0R34_1007 [Herbinix sp.]|jgi:membrane protease YdiL (CAAX protease family)|nr:hypothetical protein [Herbinix sp.]